MSTLPALDLPSLRSIKNKIIGNSSRKNEIAREGILPAIIEQLKNASNAPFAEHSVEVQTECGHIISSLSTGSSEALKYLLQAETHQVLLHALSNAHNSNSTPLIMALTRALRAYATSVTEIAGPSLWGLHVTLEPSEVKAGASAVLEDLFKLPSLDIWLPFLLSPSSQVSVSIASIIASCARNARHRDAVTHWLPPADRAKETKGKRGWERPDIVNVNSPSRGGGWLVRNSIELLKSKDVKVQESVLSALAAVFQDTPSTVTLIRKPPAEGDALVYILGFTRSRNIDVQLAACYCAANMIRASPPPPLGPHGAPPNYDGSPALTVIHVLNLIVGGSTSSTAAKTRACYILAGLARDEKEIEKIAVEVGSLDKITALMTEITPGDQSQWEDDEPEHTARLRESVLMATAILLLHWDGVRRDLSSQPFFPCVHVCMSHPHPGVRRAACQCIRALCRSVSVLRTSVVDLGVGVTLFDILQEPEEDDRVKMAALAAVCNVLNDFSPMRVVLLERGLISTLVKLTHAEDNSIRLNAVWAIKNSLFHSILREKMVIMEALGWDTLAALLLEYTEDIREQAVCIVRNLSDNDADFVFEGLGNERLAVCLESALISNNEGILLQGLCSTTNLAQGTQEWVALLVSRPRILEAIRNSLEHVNVEIRRASALCLGKIARRSPRVLHEAGIEAALGRMVDGSVLPQFEDREARDGIRMALALLQTRTSS
ncbi:hypothetical protein M422DRAFT_233362 [Sphaerobolus stellatus SS14]|uniref:Uncharacterized protein n=1 Tax=Sphaerobolus stellatus (strain SS14) TaxID=990650 RepID=A0A0C9UII0_SPHS4|nr:hypothetical protein M422DRAFT_233362 [Sphaerobolus stellatus SS14]